MLGVSIYNVTVWIDDVMNRKGNAKPPRVSSFVERERNGQSQLTRALQIQSMTPRVTEQPRFVIVG